MTEPVHSNLEHSIFIVNTVKRILSEHNGSVLNSEEIYFDTGIYRSKYIISRKMGGPSFPKFYFFMESTENNFTERNSSNNSDILEQKKRICF